MAHVNFQHWVLGWYAGGSGSRSCGESCKVLCMKTDKSWSEQYNAHSRQTTLVCLSVMFATKDLFS